MARVDFDMSQLQDDNICGECLLRGNCPLKESLKKFGIVDDPGSKTMYCKFFALENEKKE